MKRILVLCVMCILVAGCIPAQWFGGTDPATGTTYTGYLPAAAVAVGGSSVPWGGVVAGALGIITAIAQLFMQKKDDKDTGATMVKFFDQLKPELVKINTSAELNTFIVEKLPKDSAVGKWLYEAWKLSRGLK